jgi:hypothetical protein
MARRSGSPLGSPALVLLIAAAVAAWAPRGMTSGADRDAGGAMEGGGIQRTWRWPGLPGVGLGEGRFRCEGFEVEAGTTTVSLRDQDQVRDALQARPRRVKWERAGAACRVVGQLLDVRASLQP